MMSNEGYRDRILTCRDCGQEFAFTAGEQEFYASKGLTNTPSRCPSCRAARRGSHQPTVSSSRAPRGESYQTTCATCGRTTSVPFIPREDRPVYCNDCFQAQRASRPRREESRSYSGSSYNDSNSYGGDSYSDGNNYGSGRDRRDRRASNRERRDERW